MDFPYYVVLGPSQVMPDPGLKEFWNYPDGHMSVGLTTGGTAIGVEPLDAEVESGPQTAGSTQAADATDTGMWMIWAGSSSYLSKGKGWQNQRVVRELLRPGGPGEFDNGGAWLYGIFPGAQQQASIGFYHGEDHEFPDSPDSAFTAWKTIARCELSADGKSWSKTGPIISSPHPKPPAAAWGGAGDFGVARDGNGRWYCFYAEHFLYLAISDDPEARPGSWFKYHRGQFSQPGLGGLATPVPGLEGTPGGNPSVHFNHDVGSWIMVWQSWDSYPRSPLSIFISASSDLLHWSEPRLLMTAEDRALRYPTIVDVSDKQVAGAGWLHYAVYEDFRTTDRVYKVRPIQLYPQNSRNRLGKP